MIASADAKGVPVRLHFDVPSQSDMKQGARNLDLNKIMQNIGAEQFDFGTFKAAYDTDPRVRTMIKDFDKTGITPKTANELDDDSSTTNDGEGGDTVNQMAKRATDLGDL